MEGLIQSGINKIKKYAQQTYTNFANTYAPKWNQVMNNTFSQSNPNSLNSQMGRTLTNYATNRYINPIKNIPSSFTQMTQGAGQFIQKPSWQSAVKTGTGALGVLGGVATLLPDPIQDVVMPVYDFSKGYRASSLKGGNLLQNVKTGIKATTLEKPVGLGEALTTNPTLQTGLNIAELPLSLLAVGSMTKKNPNYTFKKETIDTIRKGFSPEVRKIVGEFTRMAEENPKGINRKNLGMLGEYIDSLASTVFGKDASSLTNRQLKNAFDLAMQQADRGPGIGPNFSIGLTTKNAREGLKKVSPVEGGLRIPSELEPLSRKITSSEMTKNNFIKQFNEGLKSQNLTVRETAQNTLKKIKESGLSIETFYDNVAGKLPRIKELEGNMKALRGLGIDLSNPDMYSKQFKEWQKLKYSESAPSVVEGGVPPGKIKAIPEQPFPWSVWNKDLKRWVDPTVPGEILYPKGEKIKGFTNAQLKQDASQIKYNSDVKAKEFNDMFSKWFGQRKASETTALEQVKGFEIPKGVKGEEVIRYIENPDLPVSKNAQQYASKLNAKFDELYKLAKEEGIDINYMKNYITHIWDKPPGDVAQLYRSASQRFNFAGHRAFPTYEEGIMMGLKPKFNDPQQILGQYIKNLEKTKANIEFIKNLKAEGLILPKRMPGLVPISAPGFPAPTVQLGDGTFREGVYYASQKIADQINRVFTEQKSAFNIPAQVSSKLQDVSLSGGVPRTPVNAWTFAQLTKEMLAGRIKGPVKALWTSITRGNSNKYFAENSKFIKEQQLNNVPINTTYNLENLAPRSLFDKVVGKNLGDAWSKMINEPTFKRFMPVLQTEFYKDVKNAALKSGRAEEEAIKIAAQATKNFYGLTSTADTALRSQLGKDVTTTFLFAPHYRESMINFWINNLKSLKNPLALENRANVKFIAGATILALGMDQANRAFNNGRPMSENPPGTEDKLLIPVGDGQVIGVPFLSSISTLPRGIMRQGKMVLQGNISGAIKDAGQTYLSTMIKPLADVSANQDYFGKPITQENQTPAEKNAAMGKYLATQYISHPYLKELFDARNSKDPAYQRLSRAAELPLRFYTQKTLDSKYYYGAKDKSMAGLGDQEQQAFNAIPKANIDDPNSRILKYQIFLTYPNVFAAKQKIELETAAKTGKAIDPLYLVNYDTAKKYMRYESLPEGSQDRKDMVKAYPELTALFEVRNKFFAENPIPGAATVKRPTPSAYVQQQMDAKNWKDPEVRAYLDANTAWNNAQREKLGLPPLAGFSSFPKAAKKVKKVSAGKVKKLKAIKSAKVKAIKTPKIKTLARKKYKVAKAPKIKVKVPKFG